MKSSAILNSPKAPPSGSIVVSQTPKSPSLADRAEHTFYFAYFETALGSDPIVHPVQGHSTWPVLLPDDAAIIIRRLGLGYLEDLVVYHSDCNEWKPASESIVPLTPGKVLSLRPGHVFPNTLRYDEVNRAVESLRRVNVASTLLAPPPLASSLSLVTQDGVKRVIHVVFFPCQTFDRRCLPISYTFENIPTWPWIDVSKLPDLASQLVPPSLEGIELLHPGLMLWMNTPNYVMAVTPGQRILIRRAGTPVYTVMVQKLVSGLFKASDTKLRDYPLVPMREEPPRHASPMSVEPSNPVIAPAKELNRPSSPMQVEPPSTGVPAPRRPFGLAPVSPVSMIVTKSEPEDDIQMAQLLRACPAQESGQRKAASMLKFPSPSRPAVTWDSESRDDTYLSSILETGSDDRHSGATPPARVTQPSQLVQRRKKSISDARSETSRRAPRASPMSITKISEETHASPPSTPTALQTAYPQPTPVVPEEKINPKTNLKIWPGQLTIAKIVDAFSKLPKVCPKVKDGRKARREFVAQFNNEFPDYKFDSHRYNSLRRDFPGMPEDERSMGIREHGDEPFFPWWQEWARRKGEQNMRDEDARMRGLRGQVDASQNQAA
ncbi:hypothetical protein EST38_g2842 [Candolleomyces aberdarensis]|uniref:Uncharacterized protein n=1 Tax=Candolleomyces aberdarensis TaxID=2316362 RepID=A0A4Q2DUK7_9AGAR|nr:hypothetical protein EST38_g2842 [Candolleomyces aberdarensis]